MGKRICLVMVYIFIVASVFAAPAQITSFGFDIVWYKQAHELTTLHILNYSNDTAISTKALTESSESQNLCRFRLNTNRGGIHRLSYKASPLTATEGESEYKVGYILSFTFNDTTKTLTVGTSSDLYPENTTVYTDISVPFGTTSSSFDVLVDIEITDLESAVTQKNYSATIYVERSSV